MQWLDAATYELLKDLVTEPEVRYLLLVGAYRDNESAPHTLWCLRWRRSAGPAPPCRKSLRPLVIDDMDQLVGDHCEFIAPGLLRS